MHVPTGTMLPPYIIEELRRREEARKEHEAQIELEMPLAPRRSSQNEDEPERGVVIIELMQ